MPEKLNIAVFSCFVIQLAAALTLQLMHFADWRNTVLEYCCTSVFMLCMLAFQILRIFQKKAAIVAKQGTQVIVQQIIILLVVFGFLTYSSLSPLLLCLLEYILYKYACKYGCLQ